MSTAPHDPVFALCDAFVDDLCKVSPISASTAGVPGIFDGWDDYSPEGGERARALFARYAADLAALPPSSDRWARVARRTLADFLEDKIGYYAHFDNLCDVNNIESPIQHLRMVFDVMDVSEAAGWEAVATRLSTIDRPLGQLESALDAGQKRGLVASKRQVIAALAQVRLHATDKSSFRELLQMFDASPHAEPALRARLEAGVAHTAKAFAEFSTFLERYLDKATPKDAMGAERYARAAKRYLGMNVEMAETYAWGFEQIRSIEAAMREVCAKIAPGKSIAQVVSELERSGDEIVESTEEFLRLMRARQERALADLLDRHFEVPDPIRRIDVRLAPSGGALGAYYIPPNESFSRPGTIFYAPADGESFRLFREITTAYHEGFPGHHLQCGLQVYLASHLTRLHRLFVVCSGYAEGWALYAEQLMDELGYYDRPSYVLGMLMAKLFRAVRVVVDIGMHLELRIPSDFDFHPGEVWSFDHCVEILTKRAFIPVELAKSEATRYLGWPGQAISYKVGERVILELRDEARRTLGPAFDLRTFHDTVLSSGSVGLEHLQEIVRGSFTPST